jgi:hypothetical protein
LLAYCAEKREKIEVLEIPWKHPGLDELSIECDRTLIISDFVYVYGISKGRLEKKVQEDVKNGTSLIGLFMHVGGLRALMFRMPESRKHDAKLAVESGDCSKKTDYCRD